MIRPIGLLIPASNTTVEIECNRVLPRAFQVHVGRLLMQAVDAEGWRTQDADIDYQARLLGTARVELVILAQTAASLFADGYDDAVIRRMHATSGAPADTAGRIVGRAARALGARRIGLASPWSAAVTALAPRYFTATHGLEVVAAESFGAAADNQAIRAVPHDAATAALRRVDRAAPDLLVLAGGGFPALDAIAAWETQFGKPVVTTTQAMLWAILNRFDATERLAGHGRLLADLPADPASRR
jgi:maleate isomerase